MERKGRTSGALDEVVTIGRGVPRPKRRVNGGAETTAADDAADGATGLFGRPTEGEDEGLDDDDLLGYVPI